MEDARSDLLVIARDQPPAGLVQHDQARGVRRANPLVRVIDPGAGIKVEVIAVDENRAVRRVVRPNARAGGQVEAPKNNRAVRARLARRRFARDPARVEAHRFAAIVDQINAVALDGDGRSDAGLGPVEVGVLLALGHGQLPAEAPVFFVETHEHAAVALVPRVARLAVVGADEDTAAGDDGRGMRLGPESRAPLDIFAGLRVEFLGQAPLFRNHVTGPALAPLRLVGRRGSRRNAGEGTADANDFEGSQPFRLCCRLAVSHRSFQRFGASRAVASSLDSASMILVGPTRSWMLPSYRARVR